MMIRRLLIPFLTVVLCIGSAHAQLTMVLAPSVQNSARGRELVFSGTLANTSAAKLYLNDISYALNVGQESELPFQPNSFFSNVPGVLLPGESYTNSELFRVALRATAPASDYRGAVTVRGGAAMVTNDALATADFAVLSPQVDIAATDPSASEFGPDEAALTVSRTGGSDIDLAIPFALSGTAAPGFDYVAPAGSIIIPAGSSEAILKITPIPNNIAQGDRSVNVTLDSAAPTYNPGAIMAADAVIHDKPADAWRFEHFGANANDPAAADDADWDHDGISNLMEFALSSDPKMPDTVDLPTAFRLGDYLGFSFTPNAAAADVTFIVEGSRDLRTWSTAEVEEVPEANPLARLLFRLKYSVHESSRGFMRLRVVRTDP